MKYLKNISLFLLILGCKSILNDNFNLHDTNHKLGKLKFQEDSIISRNYDNKISIVGVYNPLIEKENFKVNIYIKKKGLQINPESILINEEKINYSKYKAELKVKSSFNKSIINISLTNSRDLLTHIYDKSTGKYINIDFKDNWNVSHSIKFNKEYILAYITDFDKEIKISKNILQKRIDNRKIEIEKTELKTEYDEIEDYYIYSMKIPKLFEKSDTPSETYETFVIANYYPCENLNILFLNLSLYSDQLRFLNSIYDENDRKLKIEPPVRTLKNSKTIKETLNIVLSPQKIIELTKNIEKDIILRLKAYGEKGEFTFEIYKPLLLKFLKEVDHCIKNLQSSRHKF
ncbi:hypothetical protein [Borreliella americana]|uniref:hypothetical protein n=1 Tax=Borreliella americana TaxID=478807 RepID=UPI001E45B6AE|nr:hypothetical protein [Borreliella americana]MCD2332611.1 hypothetical protein [Borreliella americana]MCD2349272.1 hypothetical protein [Borreliella americana]MCD2381999.1 hypothetical protein [Borreliella americana]